MIQRTLQVLVVDDTVVYRRVLQNVVAEIPGATVVGIAANGRIALDRLEQLDVDFVLLDVEMPELDGIGTLKEIRQRWPGIGVVLLSGGDRRSADLTMQALELGALDFVPKADTGDVQRNHRQLVNHLTGVMRAFEVARSLGVADRSIMPKRAPTGAPPAVGDAAPRQKAGPSVSTSLVPGANRGDRTPVAADAAVRGRNNAGLPVGAPGGSPSAVLRAGSRLGIDVVLIGCSTGGPQALAKLIPLFPGDLGVPLLVVQHMPPVFTASLAENLNRESKLLVAEAVDNQVILPNTVLIAPGGRHMTVKAERGSTERRVALNDGPMVNSVRPAVDVLFQSAVQHYGGATLSVILTGMGEDGLEGVRSLRAVGGRTLTQHAASCVVYGMPRAIERAGFSDESVHLEDLASRIVTMVRQAQNPKHRISHGG